MNGTPDMTPGNHFTPNTSKRIFILLMSLSLMILLIGKRMTKN